MVSIIGLFVFLEISATSAIAANIFAQYLAGAVFPLFASYTY